jgi:oligoendopeptidase F
MEGLKTRDQIEQKYKWNLKDLFESDEKWEETLNEIKALVPEFSKYKGKLKDKKQLKSLFELDHKVSLLGERLYVYAKMSRDQDNGNDKYVSMCDRAYSVLMNGETESAFVTPELTLMSDEELLTLADDPDFKDFSLVFKGIVRNKQHLLSEGEERLLTMSSEMAGAFDTIFTMLDDVDMKFGTVKMPDGTEKELSHGRYSLMLQDKCRDVRRQAYEKMYDAHINNINTLAALYSSSVKKDVFYARARHFDSVLEGELFSGNIPLTVYDGLIEAMHRYFPEMHRYVKLRGKILKLDDLKMYDMYVPLIEVPDVKYTFLQAMELAKKALKPLGEDYIDLLDRSFNENWIDVYENKGKTSGAYSWGAYGVHPYMLLNFQNRLDDVFTLVHEAGHSMHTYYSDNSLPYEKAQYRIFVAEVASTVNEVLLLKYLIKNASDDSMKAYLLNHLLDQFRTTVFRQTMFAEFEKKVHTLQENGEALTVNLLNTVYGDLNRAYYGDGVETDKYIATEWSRIPHFYRAYYVYQYATGFSSAVAIADMILNEGAPAVERYKKFLSSGGSDFPVELLKLTGVDLSKPDAVEQALQVFKNTLDEFQGMIKL